MRMVFETPAEAMLFSSYGVWQPVANDQRRIAKVRKPATTDIAFYSYLT